MDEPVTDGVLTIQLLKSVSNEFDIESIHTVSLSKLGLTNIAAVGGCLGLERLDLSYNDISPLQSLSPLANLLVLNLSGNRITSLNGLQCVDKLERLDLSGNLLGSIDTLKPLIPLRSLHHLRLQDTLRDLRNPVCMRQSYKSEVTQLLLQLESLDGEILKGPNAEVFTLMAEIENELVRKSSPRRDGPVKTATPPLQPPEDLFVLHRNPEEQPSLAEEQFRSCVTESERLNERSAQLIAQAKEKLRDNEVV